MERAAIQFKETETEAPGGCHLPSFTQPSGGPRTGLPPTPPPTEGSMETIVYLLVAWGFPSGASDKEPACQYRRCKRCRFDPWGGGKIPWRRKWQPTPLFLPGEPHGQRSLEGYSQPMGSERNGHDWTDLAHTSVTYMTQGLL